MSVPRRWSVGVAVAACMVACATGCAQSPVAAANVSGPDYTPAAAGSASPAVPAPPPCPAVNASAARAAGMPELTLSCLGSKQTVDVARLRGPAVVNLWASWCRPCQQEVPLLEQAAEQQAGSPPGRVQIVGVNTNDQTSAALRFLRNSGAHYGQLSDPNGKLAIALHAPGLPVTVAIDASGAIVWRKIGVLAAADVVAAVRAAGGGDERASANAS